jgi:hypothetical protein
LAPRLRKLRSRIFLDRATEDDTVFVAGMGRSGTTWLADLINHDGKCRVMFEPFNPQRVREARPFRYVQYVNAESHDGILVESARTILSGRIRNRWVDLDNRKLTLTRRLVKDVRCNLMLRWLKTVCPRMSVVLLVRHPLSVALSWLKLGWGLAREGSDFQVMVDQRELLQDFPVLADALSQIDVDDALERIICQWCVFYSVPVTQFQGAGLTVLFYENLLIDPRWEAEKLFASLRWSCDWSQLAHGLTRPSRTDFLRRGGIAIRDHQQNAWKHAFTGSQIRRARDILSMFGLENVYKGERPAEGLVFAQQPGRSVL